MLHGTPDPYILSDDLRRLLGGISRSTEWRLRKTDPQFPAAVRIIPGKIGYRLADVERYLASRPRAVGLEPGRIEKEVTHAAV